MQVYQGETESDDSDRVDSDGSDGSDDGGDGGDGGDGADDGQAQNVNSNDDESNPASDKSVNNANSE